MDTRTLVKTLSLERLEVNLFRGTTPFKAPGGHQKRTPARTP